MKNKLIGALAITMAMAVALLFVSSGPAAAAAPHATGPGLMLELEHNPAWINMGWVGAEYNTPQAQLPAVLRASNECMPQGQSPSYLYCAWTGRNYTGGFYAWNTWYNHTCVPTSGLMNDSITSFWNQMPQYTAAMYIDGGCQNPPGFGGQKIFYSGSSTGDIRCYTTSCWQFDDRISSFKTY